MTTLTSLCNAEQSLLLIVDMQNRLSAVMPEVDAQMVLDNCKNLMHAAGILNIPVLLTEQYPKGLGPTDSRLTERFPERCRILEKTGFSCCASKSFNQALADSHCSQVILAGQESHVCVLQTAMSLLHQGLQVFVVEDAVCSRKAGHKYYALQRMQQQGAIISNYESVLFEWLKDASHPAFKSIANNGALTGSPHFLISTRYLIHTASHDLTRTSPENPSR